jgi:hypothetical protein
MTAIERLRFARNSFLEGRYPEALLDFVWFHENALAERPSLYGVRRSSALADWAELGRAYPPAMKALEDTRDRTVAVVRQGDGSRSAFIDVVAINEYLNSTSATYSLYLALMNDQPELAAACAQDALPSIVAAEDYRLAAQLVPAPETLIRKESSILNYQIRMLKFHSYSRAPTRWAYVCNFVAEIQLLLKIQVGIGAHREAARLKSLAIALIQSPSLRREVQGGFVKRAKAPYRRR